MLTVEWFGEFIRGKYHKDVTCTFTGKSWPDIVDQVVEVLAREGINGWKFQKSQYVKISGN